MDFIIVHALTQARVNTLMTFDTRQSIKVARDDGRKPMSAIAVKIDVDATQL
jgi:hypothetical protein